MSFLQIYAAGFAVIMIYMTLIWLASLPLKNSSIVDIFWGLGFFVAALVYFGLTEGYATRKLLLVGVVGIWGVRLSVYIFLRNRGKGEDFRYQKWREHQGGRYWWYSYFQVFVLQGVLMWLISSPLLMSQYSAEPAYLTVFDILGVGIWAIGFFFEAVGDWQLSRFKANPANKGQVMRSGLWKYTRHPNYFGDATVWWGFFMLAVAVPNGFLTIYAPLLMTRLLMRVSGVTLLEKTLTKTKPGYQEYIETTSAFFPRPPKKMG